MNMNIGVTSALRALFFASFSLFLLGCLPDEDPLIFYDLRVTFTQEEQDLGVVNIQPSNVTCSDTCTSSIAENTVVDLIATPKAGYTFTGWGGSCAGDTNCQLTMSAAHSVTATFAEIPAVNSLSLQVSVGGSIVLADNLGRCDSGTCNIDFPLDKVVTATAIPKAGYTFTGWSGDCAGDTNCQLTMSAAHSVTATFNEVSAETALLISVDGGGSIALSNNLGDCAEGCDFSFTQQEVITLTATPAEGYAFFAWGGDCIGDSECVVNMVSDQTVSAIFKATTHSCTAQAPLPTGHFDAHPDFPYHNPAYDGSRSEALLTDFMVKETSGKGASNYPVSMVFPLERGQFFHPGDFHIRNSAGDIIPAQFNVINRWWAKDRSLRHIQAHFNVDIDPYTEGEADTGRQTFNLYAGNGNVKPNYSVCTTESDSEILLDNGLVDIAITKNPLTITTPAGQLKSLFVKENGDSDDSFNHDNIKIELEEIGYLRTVVKISSLTDYINPMEIKHGWSVRLYMYANSDKVKVDFQLQNSALNTEYSAPLYFESHELVLDDTGSTGNQLIKAASIDKDKILSGLSGALSVSKVNVFFRDFWQKFPQGIAAKTDGNVSIELWPAWSKQFLDQSFAEADFYWLDDMKQTYKEVLLDFSRQNNTEYLDNIARNFQYSPVAIVPQSYYQKTQVTFELGGLMPKSDIPEELARLPEYKTKDFEEQTSPKMANFGQDNFGLGNSGYYSDKPRKRATNGTGGTPYSKRFFYVTGNPQHYYSTQGLAKAELNIRPQWLAGYNHDNDYSSLRPTANPYGGNTWRRFKGHGRDTLSREYISGSMQVAHPRDDQHAWFYHMEHAYLASGNKWIKDWYEFMAEYKKAYLQELDPFPDRSHRADGHNLSVALSSYKMTNNESLGELLVHYTRDVQSKYLVEPHNISKGNSKGENYRASVFQLAYLVKPLIELTYEFPDQELTLDIIKSTVDWNYHYSNYSYYRSTTDYEVSAVGNGTGGSFVDAAVWYSVYTSDAKYAEHAVGYVNDGIGGVKPYGSFKNPWKGTYTGQAYNYYLQNK